MNAVVAHFRRQWAQQMSNPLLLLDVHIEIADHHEAAVGANVFFAAAELSRRHVALHDVYAVFFIERDTRYLVKADHVVLTYQPPLPGRVIDEHFLPPSPLPTGSQSANAIS